MSTPDETAVVRVGPAGWAYDDWAGTVYPPGFSPRKTHPLGYLCAFFDTIEIDSSFYRPPTPRSAAAWATHVEANPRFRFTAKLWQRFTHQRDSWPSPAEVQSVMEGIMPLHEAGRFGAMLAQFPWSFRRTPENRTWLARLVDTFTQWPLAIELRHASWDRPEVYEGLCARGVTFCNIDQPVLRDSIAPSDKVTAPTAYVRLHGRNAEAWFKEGAGRDARYNYLYSGGELELWLGHIQRMRGQAREIYVVTNNHFEGQAVANAFELQDGLGLSHPAPPECLAERYPRLRKHSGDTQED